MLSQILTAIIALAGLQLRRATNRDKRASTSSGSETKASKSPITLPMPTCSPRKSSKISKLPSNNSAKSHWTLLLTSLERRITIDGDELGRCYRQPPFTVVNCCVLCRDFTEGSFSLILTFYGGLDGDRLRIIKEMGRRPRQYLTLTER